MKAESLRQEILPGHTGLPCVLGIAGVVDTKVHWIFALRIRASTHEI